MNETPIPVWCENPEMLSDRQLGLVIDSAAAVLAEGAGDDIDVREIRQLPSTVLAPDLAEALVQAGVRTSQQDILQFSEEAARNRALAIALLRQIRNVPALCAEVDAAYEASKRLMIADPITIGAISLFLLIMKLRRIKIGREGLDVTLDPIRNGMASAIKDLIGG